MEFLSLKYFCTTVEAGSISKAAEQLYITQQSLSGYIARLEKKYDCIFFLRHPKLQLTPAGEQFYAFAKKTWEEHERVSRQISQSRHNLRLPVGVARSYERYLFPGIGQIFHQKNPHVILSLITTNRPQQEARLKNLDVYCCIGSIAEKYAKTHVENILAGGFYALISKQDIKANPEVFYSGKISLLDVLKMPLILPPKQSNFRRSLDTFCSLHRIVPDVKIESSNMEASYLYHKMGFGNCILPQIVLYNIMTNEGLPQDSCALQLDISDSPLKADNIHVIYRSDLVLPDYVQLFIQCCKDYCRNYSAQMKQDLLNLKEDQTLII